MIYFLIPMYNEEANLRELYNNLIENTKNYEAYFVFVDDNSSDSSVSVVSDLFANENLKLITKEKNAGPGDSFNLGFEWILEDSRNQNDIVVTLEADNTSDIGILAKMIAINSLGYDLVLASVYAQGGGFDRTSLWRKILSYGGNMLIRFIFDIKILTLSSFYRVYSLSLLQKIKEKNGTIIKESGFICMLEILRKAIKAKASIIEVPMILHSAKRKGKSKMKVFKTIMIYLRFLLKKS